MEFKNSFADVSSNFDYKVLYVKSVGEEHNFLREFSSLSDAMAFAEKIYSNSDVLFIEIYCVIKEDWSGICDE